MPTFACDSCQKKIRVPDAYVGKRVRCPGCGQAQRVPEPDLSAGDSMESFAALEAGESAVGIRKLREILIGCGVCQKTIRLPTRAMGRTKPCPKCGATLKVDEFDLSKAKGDLVDLSHLELDAAEPSLHDTSSHGSTLGGSSIQLEGSGLGTGYAMNDTSMGSTLGGTLTDSQSQMRELRELNDLKHSGAISSDEYKRRKAEIYSGRSLAIQAMSRSADGSGNTHRAPSGPQGGGVPGPVKMLVGVAVLGIGAMVLWNTVLKQAMQDGREVAQTVAAGEAPAPTVAESDGEPTAAAGSMFSNVPDDLDETQADPSVETAGAEASGPASASDADRTAGEPPATDESAAGVSVPDDVATATAVEDVTPRPEAEVLPPSPDPPVAPEDVEFVVLDWPAGWPDQTPSSDLPITRACSVIKQIDMSGHSAYIGVAVGPAVTGLADPAYRAFRSEMQEVMTSAALENGLADQMNMREYASAMKLSGFECHRLLFTFRNRRGDQVTILTGVQDGRSVAYWFVGSGRVYTKFIKTVGLAELGPKA